MKFRIGKRLFPGGQPADGAAVPRVKALPQQLLGAGGGGNALIAHAPRDIQHGGLAGLQHGLPVDVVGKIRPIPPGLLVDLRKLLRIGHTGREGEQRKPRLLAENEHMVPAGSIGFPALSQFRGLVDLVQRLIPLTVRAETDGAGFGTLILNGQPENQRPFTHGGEIGAGEAELLFLRDEAGDPAVLTAPYGVKGQTLAVQLHIGTDQPVLSADFQKSLDLHVQEGDALDGTVVFPDGGQGQIFVASDLIRGSFL